MRIAIVAGEPSGDQLGADLIKALRKLNPCIHFDGVGGEKMQHLGFNSYLPMEDFAVMGLTEIVKSLPRLLKHRKRLFDIYQASMPDIFIGIDYPEFNLSLEKKLRATGIYTVHYVSPSVWAWREKRIHSIKESADLMLTLFDFEKHFYDTHKMPAVFCGHPLVDQINPNYEVRLVKNQLNLHLTEGNFLAVLPGSRKTELTRMLPIYINVCQKLAEKQADLVILVPVVSATHQEMAEKILENSGLEYRVIVREARKVMKVANAVLITSGTATLEAMLLEKPMVVSYQVSNLTGMLAKRLVQLSNFSLPNLIADHPIVPEYVQDDIDVDAMADDLYDLINDTPKRQKMIKKLQNARTRLKTNGAETAAKAIYEHFNDYSLSKC